MRARARGPSLTCEEPHVAKLGGGVEEGLDGGAHRSELRDPPHRPQQPHGAKGREAGKVVAERRGQQREEGEECDDAVDPVPSIAQVSAYAMAKELEGQLDAEERGEADVEAREDGVCERVWRVAARVVPGGPPRRGLAEGGLHHRAQGDGDVDGDVEATQTDDAACHAAEGRQQRVCGTRTRRGRGSASGRSNAGRWEL